MPCAIVSIANGQNALSVVKNAASAVTDGRKGGSHPSGEMTTEDAELVIELDKRLAATAIMLLVMRVPIVMKRD